MASSSTTSSPRAAWRRMRRATSSTRSSAAIHHQCRALKSSPSRWPTCLLICTHFPEQPLGPGLVTAPLDKVPQGPHKAAHIDHPGPGVEKREEQFTHPLIVPVVGAKCHFSLKMFMSRPGGPGHNSLNKNLMPNRFCGTSLESHPSIVHENVNTPVLLLDKVP